MLCNRALMFAAIVFNLSMKNTENPSQSSLDSRELVLGRRSPLWNAKCATLPSDRRQPQPHSLWNVILEELIAALASRHAYDTQHDHPQARFHLLSSWRLSALV